MRSSITTSRTRGREPNDKKEQEKDGDDEREKDGDDEQEEDDDNEQEEDDDDEIFIRIPHLNKTITLNIDPTDTTRVLKAAISGNQGIPRSQQRLIFGDIQLEDERTLASYDIKAGYSVTLMLRITGGASGGKRPRGPDKIHDYNIQTNDHPEIAAILSVRGQDLKTFMLDMNDTVFEDFHSYALEQKNGDRIMDKVCRDSPHTKTVMDSSKTNIP